MNGPKDKTKKGNASNRSKEESDKAGSSEKAASSTESESQSPATITSSNPPELCIEPFSSSGNSPSLQDDVDNTIQSIFANPGLAEHRYISLTEYSVLRAFVQNASLLAIDATLFADDLALSPWTISNPYPSFTPHDLSPTILQLSTPHHPYIDTIAPPSLRDSVLLSAMTDEQEEQLCYELHCGSFTIWGSQPWSALGM